MRTLLTPKEVAERLAVSETTVHRLVARGELPAIRVGRQWRFAPADVESYLARTREAAS